MKALTRFTLSLLLFTLACATLPVLTPPTMRVLYAQTLPTTVKFSWDVNPAADLVVDYVTSLDVGPSQTQPLTVCTATRCQVTLTVSSEGSHVAAVYAQNLKLSTDPLSLISGSATSVNFTLKVTPPTAPKNGSIGQ